MCLAIVGKVLRLSGETAVADVRGNQIEIATPLVPDVKPADYVLIHAGFAIAVVSENEYQEHQRIFEEIDRHARWTLESR